MELMNRIERIEERVFALMKEDQATYFLNQRLTVFLSVGTKKRRARVHTFRGKRMASIFQKIKNFLLEHPVDYDWIKVDVAKNFHFCSFAELNDQLRATRKNYFRRGIAFDARFTCAFLEEELNGNAMLTPDKDTPELRVNLKNMTRYVEQQRRKIPRFIFTDETSCILFETTSVFSEEEPIVIETTGTVEKVRVSPRTTPFEIKTVVTQASDYLARQVQADGRFIYGYFSCFDKTIQFYNSLRHASTLYSMIEAYAVRPDVTLQHAIDRAKNYLIEHLIVQPNESAYVVDWEQDAEIKLGANAAAILALTKYMTTFKSRRELALCRALANGIVGLQQPAGNFNHVLSYPSLALKEAFRIIYYEGEATFALLRLYELDRQERWLASVTQAFDYFIAHDYWKQHDHWLSYSVNELTKYVPDERYYRFGLQNVEQKLDFIHHRETTYPTFLELMLAAREMIGRMQADGQTDLLTTFPLDWLEATIERRMQYQLTGFYYPEVAMYMKVPERILGSFYIRHHSFRVRIDDVEHNISGYCRALEQIRQKEVVKG
ncbi:hypothetical protein [Exiguobacterium oxidotolerans]|uniref:Poly (Glycerol-phosphate) alpha-glucosyltransferase n=1 Tax=Exiguobacterium oxidotolerans TaxID=223958 RepID=A0A653I9T4_9BACL|nr:hypothetical protein [Exiguobacterium oxidotolerans]VWX35601.1 conserved hypothetical protein [Exiguobacterium oxidotolerans]